MANLQPTSFGPFRRYISTQEQHLLPADAISSGLNMMLDPVAGGFFKRSGSLVGGGETLDANKRATTGILESAPEWVPCRLREFFSTSLSSAGSSGYPTYSVLYRREPSSSSWPTVDDGWFGTDYIRRGTDNYNLLKEFSSDYYPTGGGAMGDEVRFRVTPWWYESGEGGYSRGATEFTRRFCASGSWNSLDAGKWRFYGGLRATPMEWDGGCNTNGSANALTFRPTGPFSPLWIPTITATAASPAETTLTNPSKTSPFVSGHTFWYSVIFQMDDGSYTLPTIPREVNGTLTSGYGLAVIGTPAAAGSRTGYSKITMENIPIGPSGTRARVVLRSNIEIRAAASDPITVGITPAPDGTGGLQVLGVLDNNTQTSLTVTSSNDDSLVQNSDVVRYDLICPPRARYLGTGDNRAIAGYTLPSPNAIQLTCVGITTAYDMNLAQDSASLSGSSVPVYKVTTTGLVLGLFAGGSLTSTTIDWATYATIQDVIDKVNSTSDVGGSGHYGQWRAQLAPGADPSAPSSNLCPTIWTSSSSTSAASTNLTVDATTLAAVPLGYKVYDSTGTIASGTYVASKTSTQLVLSAAASGAGASATLDFYPDTGDTAVVSATSFGWIRVFGTHIPGMIYFRRTKMPGYDQPAKNRIYFTTSSPGAASTGVSLAPRAWVRSNRRDGKSFTGQIMGIVDVLGAAVILYRNRKALFINERGNNTGEDFDMRLQTLDDTRGCISPWSVIGVNGCAVFASPIGIEAVDKSKRVVRLSRDVYESVRGKGDLAYEIGQCVARSAQDSPDCWLGTALWESRLVVSYRGSASTYYMLVYDFSAGIDSSGVESLANPSERSPYGWSTPLVLDTTHAEFGPRAMGQVANASGTVLFGALNDNNGTNDGRVDRLFYGTTDNGVTIQANAYTAARLASPGTKVSNQNITVVHKITYSGVTASCARVNSGASTTVSLTTAGSYDQKRERKQLAQTERTPGDRCYVGFEDNTTSTGGLVWGVDVESEVLAWRGGD